MPTIGTNNGLTYFQSAFYTLYSLLSCLENEESELLKNLTGIVILTPFNADQTVTSVHTMQHLFNLFKIYRNTREEPVCDICATMKSDTILGCGHRFCLRCVMDQLNSITRQCPMCRKPITRSYPCYKITDSHDHQCCGAEKEPCIFVPCGHMYALCKKCGEDLVDNKPNLFCVVCAGSSYAYMHLYQ
jgi:hypothetical protein